MPNFRNDLQCNQNQLLQAVLQVSGEPPSPVEGQIYYDSITNRAYYYDGVSFVQMGVEKLAEPVDDDDAATKAYVDAAVTAGAGSASLNLITNCLMKMWQRGTSLSGLSDGDSGPDGWYVLSQTGDVDIARQGDVDDTAYGMRITNTSGGAQRLGVAQIIESADARGLALHDALFDLTITPSVTSAYRAAVLAWEGTADVVPRDFVNDWTSTDLGEGAGNFFVDTDITIDVGPNNNINAGNTERVFDRFKPDADMRNLILFIWTTGTIANGAYFDVGRLDLHAGGTRRKWEPVTSEIDVARCLRRFRRVNDFPLGIAASTANLYYPTLQWPVPMRTTPVLENATFSADAGSNGTPLLVGENENFAAIINNDADWAPGASISLDADFNAEL